MVLKYIKMKMKICFLCPKSKQIILDTISMEFPFPLIVNFELLPCNLVIAALLHNGCCLSAPPALHLVASAGNCRSGAKPGHATGPAGLEELLRHQAEGGGAVGGGEALLSCVGILQQIHVDGGETLYRLFARPS